MAGHLLVAAERYNIERLKLICEERMCNLINPDIVATSLALAEQHGLHRIKEACFEFLASPSNLEAMMSISRIAAHQFSRSWLLASCPPN